MVHVLPANMPSKAAALRFPHERTFLPRTKLAYVHLRNLLTDAKRDRAARVFGYVAIWLPEELVMLYLQEGEVVNATTSLDGRTYEAVPIAAAIGRVPTEPELGEVTFQEADDEQLACMFCAQTMPPEPWPSELDPRNPRALFPYLAATTFDGTVEIVVDSTVNYLVFRDGTVTRGFLVDGGAVQGSLVERVRRLFPGTERRAIPDLRRWPVPPPLAIQAPPSLIKAYRELANTIIAALVAEGAESAPAVAEQARLVLCDKHPCLDSWLPGGRIAREPVVDSATLSAAMAEWASELLWAVTPESTSPEEVLRAATHERRHMFQSAGLFDALPWKVDW